LLERNDASITKAVTRVAQAPAQQKLGDTFYAESTHATLAVSLTFSEASRRWTAQMASALCGTYATSAPTLAGFGGALNVQLCTVSAR